MSVRQRAREKKSHSLTMYRSQRERIPDLLESPNSRRDLRNARLSNDQPRRYEPGASKYDRLSPHPRRRLTNNLRLEQQYQNFQEHSSSDEGLSRNKSKSTSSIDTQSVNNILDEYEDLDYRKFSDLSDIEVNDVEVTNFDEMMDMQKRQVAERQNSRMFRSQNEISLRDQQHQAVTSPIKISRQTQVQQRSRDRQKSGERRRNRSPSDERLKSYFTPIPNNAEVRSSIRSAKSPPEVVLRKGEVQKRVDEWLSQTRSQNCAGFSKESRGLTRSNSSAEQKSHRRLRQQELRSRRSQLNGSSSYDDLTREGLKIQNAKTTDNVKVSIGVNTSRGTYKQYLALKNKARLQKQQQEITNQESARANSVLRSREASPSTARLNYHARTDTSNQSFRSSSSRREEAQEFEQQQHQQQQPWSDEAAPAIKVRGKNARVRHQMENRISSLVKARNEAITAPEASSTTATTTTTAVIRRSSFKRESTRSASRSGYVSTSSSKDKEAVATPQTNQNEAVTEAARNIEHDRCSSRAAESNPPTESSSDLSQEIYGSVSARVRAFQGRSEHRMPKSRSLQGSNILIETRNKSPMSPTRRDGQHYKEGDRNQSTFKPNAATINQQNDQTFVRRDREVDTATKYVEKIYETTLQPQVIHADNLESVFKPGQTNFVYGDTTLKDTTSQTVLKADIDSGTQKICTHSKDSDRKLPDSGFNHCLKLLQRSPSFRLKRSRVIRRENERENHIPLTTNEQTNVQQELNCQPQTMKSFGSGSSPFVPVHTSKTENSSEQLVVQEKLDPNSYEARSTLKLNNANAVNNIIENHKNRRQNSFVRENSFIKENSSVPRQAITTSIDGSKSDNTPSSTNSINLSEPTHGTKEKSEDGAVINEVLVKNLQFKQDLPAKVTPAPPPRSIIEPPKKPESALIVELMPLYNRPPLNYNSVLDDNYANLRARKQQDSEKIYFTKEELERKKLMDLLRKGEFNLVKSVSPLCPRLLKFII